jgi:dihydroxy-acid dehydratase
VQILYGNLAPEGSVAKITGKEGLQFRGPARVFDSEEDMLAVVAEDPQQLKVRKHLVVFPPAKAGFRVSDGKEVMRVVAEDPQ